MNTLQHSIEIAGGRAALAKALGCTVRNVHHWCKNGLPALREVQLKALYGRRKMKPKQA